MILSLVWLLLVGVSADCQEPPCLRLCCPLGQVRVPGSVPVAKHRCETDFNIPDFLPDCVKTSNSLQLVEATTSALRRYQNIKEENLLGPEKFSCPHVSESLVLASQLLGDFDLVLQEGGLHNITNLAGGVILQTRSLCLAMEEDKQGDISSEIFMCYSDVLPEEIHEKFVFDVIYIICIFVSFFFFLITFIVYVILPDLREHFFGKLMMAFLLNAFLNFFLLGIKRCLDIVYREKILLTPICYFLGYTIHHTFISFFFWMSAMAINFTYKFSNVLRCPSGSEGHSRRNIILICLFGQGNS